MKKIKVNFQFGFGIIIILIGALLMFFELLPLPIRIFIGIIGVVLIATSKFKLLR